MRGSSTTKASASVAASTVAPFSAQSCKYVAWTTGGLNTATNNRPALLQQLKWVALNRISGKIGWWLGSLQQLATCKTSSSNTVRPDPGVQKQTSAVCDRAQRSPHTANQQRSGLHWQHDMQHQVAAWSNKLCVGLQAAISYH